MDDVQTLYRNQTPKMRLISQAILQNFMIPLTDSNQACFMLITSDYSIAQDVRSLSGMTSRLITYTFPKVNNKAFDNYIETNLGELLSINAKITPEIMKNFYNDFNSDFRSLNRFMVTYEGDYSGW